MFNPNYTDPVVEAAKKALTPKQKQLDVDKDGNIEGSDLAKLRSQKNEEDPCWKGYKMVGMKKKDGKEVPNCVPESIEQVEEAIKPYVSGDHASGWDVLDHTGKTVKTFHHKDYADHPIKDKRKAAQDDAHAYLKKHFNKLSKPVSESDDQIDEASGEMTKSQIMQKINNGTHEAMHDIVPGKHVELRHTQTGKKTMVFVKHMKEDADQVDEAAISLSKVEKIMGNTQSADHAVKEVVRICKCSEAEARKLVNQVIDKAMKEGVNPTADYKLTPSGRKVRAHAVVLGTEKEEVKEESEQVEEKTLTSAEMKKREEIAKAIERDNPSMPMDKKMAIATATAKKVAEELSPEQLKKRKEAMNDIDKMIDPRVKKDRIERLKKMAKDAKIK